MTVECSNYDELIEAFEENKEAKYTAESINIGDEFTPAMADALFNVLQHNAPSLKSITVYSLAEGFPLYRLYDYLAENTTVTLLSVYDNIADKKEEIDSLVNFMKKNKTLKRFRTGKSFISSETIDAINEGLTHNSTIKSITLGSSKFAKKMKFPAIKCLHFEYMHWACPLGYVFPKIKKEDEDEDEGSGEDDTRIPPEEFPRLAMEFQELIESIPMLEKLSLDDIHNFLEIKDQLVDSLNSRKNLKVLKIYNRNGNENFGEFLERLVLPKLESFVTNITLNSAAIKFVRQHSQNLKLLHIWDTEPKILVSILEILVGIKSKINRIDFSCANFPKENSKEIHKIFSLINSLPNLEVLGIDSPPTNPEYYEALSQNQTIEFFGCSGSAPAFSSVLLTLCQNSFSLKRVSVIPKFPTEEVTHEAGINKAISDVVHWPNISNTLLISSILEIHLCLSHLNSLPSELHQMFEFFFFISHVRTNTETTLKKAALEKLAKFFSWKGLF